jgi:hypothetical protein
VLGPDVEGAAVAEPAVEALADDHVDRVAVDRGAGVEVEEPAEAALPHRADGERVGQQDGALQRAQLRELAETRGLAVPVQHVTGGQDLLGVGVSAVRQHRRDAGPDRVALVKGSVPDSHARDVDQGVAAAGRDASHRVAEVP